VPQLPPQSLKDHQRSIIRMGFPGIRQKRWILVERKKIADQPANPEVMINQVRQIVGAYCRYLGFV
jgi:hypothetical protein